MSVNEDKSYTEYHLDKIFDIADELRIKAEDEAMSDMSQDDIDKIIKEFGKND